MTDPETKRKAIGNEFIAVFDDEAEKMLKAEKLRVSRWRGWCRGRCIRM